MLGKTIRFGTYYSVHFLESCPSCFTVSDVERSVVEKSCTVLKGYDHKVRTEYSIVIVLRQKLILAKLEFFS